MARQHRPDRWLFPTGLAVRVVGGKFGKQHGQVVDHASELRPRSVWVRFENIGLRLLPAHRITPVNPFLKAMQQSKLWPSRKVTRE